MVRRQDKPYKLPGGAPPPSWLNIRKDQLALQAKLDRIAKIIANGQNEYDMVAEIADVVNEDIDGAGKHVR